MFFFSPPFGRRFPSIRGVSNGFSQARAPVVSQTLQDGLWWLEGFRWVQDGPRIHHGPPKPTFLEGLWKITRFLGVQNPLFFMVLGAHGSYKWGEMGPQEVGFFSPAFITGFSAHLVESEFANWETFILIVYIGRSLGEAAGSGISVLWLVWPCRRGNHEPFLVPAVEPLQSTFFRAISSFSRLGVPARRAPSAGVWREFYLEDENLDIKRWIGFFMAFLCAEIRTIYLQDFLSLCSIYWDMKKRRHDTKLSFILPGCVFPALSRPGAVFSKLMVFHPKGKGSIFFERKWMIHTNETNNTWLFCVFFEGVSRSLFAQQVAEENEWWIILSRMVF